MEKNVISCALSWRELTARGRRWRRLRDRAGVEVVTIPAGLRLRFDADPGTERELRELADLERECCSFANWVVTVEGESIWLEVTSDADAVAAIRSTFASFR
jgi:hypothetical protein